MEVSFISLLSCNQLGWWDEQWGGHPPTPHPPLVIRSWELSEMSIEDDIPLHPSLVIRSCRLSEISNEEEDTPPTLGLQELKVNWDEQWGVHPYPHPPTLGHQELWVKRYELFHIMNKNIILECQHIETLGVWLVSISLDDLKNFKSESARYFKIFEF